MNYDIVESFAQMVREKSMDKDVLAGIIEEIFSTLMKKKYGQDAQFEVIVNLDKGEIEIFLEREIVEEVVDPNLHVSLDEAMKKSGEEFEIGDVFPEEIKLTDFGRRLVNLAKQTLSQRLREVEKDIVYNEYSQLVGEIVIGDIYQIRRDDILVNHNKNELVIPRAEQIPKERYRKGETIRAIIKEVNKEQRGPKIVISRSDDKFLAKLFELEIPEIYDGIVEIKSIAREPGERAKVAVISNDDRIDAVGACVGMKGVRIHSIVRELSNENIDVVHYSDTLETFIRRSLSPAKIKNIEINEAEKKATIWADADQVSLIIGRNGQNIRLAMKLVGVHIDVIREEKPIEEYEVDIELIDFKQEIGEEVYEKLINAGYDTAIDVLKAGMEKVKEIEGFDEDKVAEIFSILKEGFEE
ncbi:MAG: transcription termination factor NusA [Bacteroidetes bacterium]|nr:transcription termination factor NusA [Bacteroidota bacterium]MBU2584027.1 transcription termination factor NusA [Bacteroidota bacterium]